MGIIFHPKRPDNPKPGDACSDENGDVIVYGDQGWQKLKYDHSKPTHPYSLELEEEQSDGFFDLIEDCETETKIKKQCTCGHGNEWEVGHSDWCDRR